MVIVKRPLTSPTLDIPYNILKSEIHRANERGKHSNKLIEVITLVYNMAANLFFTTTLKATILLESHLLL